jgi:hypothetical protein
MDLFLAFCRRRDRCPGAQHPKTWERNLRKWAKNQASAKKKDEEVAADVKTLTEHFEGSRSHQGEGCKKKTSAVAKFRTVEAQLKTIICGGHLPTSVLRGCAGTWFWR